MEQRYTEKETASETGRSRDRQTHTLRKGGRDQKPLADPVLLSPCKVFSYNEYLQVYGTCAWLRCNSTYEMMHVRLFFVPLPPPPRGPGEFRKSKITEE